MASQEHFSCTCIFQASELAAVYDHKVKQVAREGRAKYSPLSVWRGKWRFSCTTSGQCAPSGNFILHWLASRVFLVQRTEYRTPDADPNQVSLSPGTSLWVFPQEMIISISVTTGVIIIILSLTIFMRFSGGMPLTACCTARIAASCKPLWRQDNNSTMRREFAPGLEYQKPKGAWFSRRWRLIMGLGMRPLQMVL